MSMVLAQSCLLLLVMGLLIGCGSSQPEPSSSQPPPAFNLITTAEAWQPTNFATDPFPEHQKGQEPCSRPRWLTEGDTLEIRTEGCSYLLLSQPVPQELKAGSRLRLSVWHSELSANVKTKAHVALVLGSWVLWEKIVAIPGGAASYEEELVLPTTVLTSSPIILHLHNHGLNVWNVGPISYRP